LVAKIVSEITYQVSSGMLNPTLSVSAKSAACEYDHQQTMSNTVDTCVYYESLHEVEDNAHN